MHIFSDGSFDPKSKIGIAGYLCVNDLHADLNHVESHFKTFENTNCSRLEIQALLWAIDTELVEKSAEPIFLYTDSQTIANLNSRRVKLNNEKLEQLNNGDLYKEFFHRFDSNLFEVIWVKGHKKQQEKDRVDQIFSVIDKQVRKQLRLKLNKS